MHLIGAFVGKIKYSVTELCLVHFSSQNQVKIDSDGALVSKLFSVSGTLPKKTSKEDVVSIS